MRSCQSCSNDQEQVTSHGECSVSDVGGKILGWGPLDTTRCFNHERFQRCLPSCLQHQGPYSSKRCCCYQGVRFWCQGCSACSACRLLQGTWWHQLQSQPYMSPLTLFFNFRTFPRVLLKLPSPLVHGLVTRLVTLTVKTPLSLPCFISSLVSLPLVTLSTTTSTWVRIAIDSYLIQLLIFYYRAPQECRAPLE